MASLPRYLSWAPMGSFRWECRSCWRRFSAFSWSRCRVRRGSYSCGFSAAVLLHLMSEEAGTCHPGTNRLRRQRRHPRHRHPRRPLNRRPNRAGSQMIASSPGDAATGTPPRLMLAPKRLSRAVLDGAWWPRPADAPAELTSLVQALTERYGRIRYVILNGAAWEGHIRRLPVAGHICRVGWFASMNAAPLVATTDGGVQLDLLLVPPSASKTAAGRAMTEAADPFNMGRAADLLARSDRTINRPVAAL